MRDLHTKTRIAPAKPKNKSKNKVKRERKPINWRPLVKKAAKLICIALFAIVTGLAGYEGYELVSRATILKLEKIEVTGLNRLVRGDVLAEAGVKPGDAMLKLRLDRIGEQLGKDPWVEKVRVRRYFPKTLAIEIVEREPVAVVNMGLLYYLDRRGEVFKPLSVGDRLDYPVITGVTDEDLTRDPAGTKASLKETISLLDTLNKGTVFTLADVSEIHVDKGFGFTVFTAKGGIPVRLGKGDFAVKLARFEKIYRDIQGTMTSLEYIDLDYNDKIIVKKA